MAVYKPYRLQIRLDLPFLATRRFKTDNIIPVAGKIRKHSRKIQFQPVQLLAIRSFRR